MRDVAERAGVSISTVSHVVNDHRTARISATTRDRVRQAASDLGYRQNLMAKNLVKGTSHLIGLVADSIASTPFAGQIIRGAQEAAWARGYVLLVANTEGDEGAENDAITMMLEHNVAGILYSTWYHHATELPAALRDTATVLVNCFAAGTDIPAVVPDEVDGGRTATGVLLDAGHERIAFANTVAEAPARKGRLKGYRDALEAAGLEYDPSLVFGTQPDQEGGYEVAAQILDSGASALFCHNDRVAMGVYDALRDAGLHVPADLSVVGFDNQDVIAAHLRPPLTTVALPHYELGAQGVQRLLERLTLQGSGGATRANSSDAMHDQITRIMCPPVMRRSVSTRP